MSLRRGLDHLVLAVRDLDQAAARYEACGFTLTPRAQHPWGTANRLVQLDGSFLELLEIDRPELIAPAPVGEFSFGIRVRDFLRRREGFAMLVFEGHDARADVAAFAAAGLETYAPFDFSRSAMLPDGSSATVGFSLAFVTDPRAPDATMFTCQQTAPQYFWKSQFQRHANGVQGIAAIVMQADRPEQWQEHFAALQGATAVRRHDSGLDVATARGRVLVRRSSEVAARFGGPVAAGIGGTPGFAGFILTTRDLRASETALAHAGVQFLRRADSLVVPADSAFGVGIEFVAT